MPGDEKNTGDACVYFTQLYMVDLAKLQIAPVSELFLTKAPLLTNRPDIPAYLFDDLFIPVLFLP